MYTLRLLIALTPCLLCLNSVNCSAKESGAKAVTNPKDGGIAYQLQGEYEGTVVGDKYGAHVIALPKNQFRAVGYAGGLPGNGWDQEEPNSIEGELDGAHVEMDADDFSLKIGEGSIQVLDLDGNLLGSLKKVNRQSETLGAKAPKNAIVLFDGKDVAAWNQGTLVDGKFLGATNCYSKETFGDHQLHIEFRTPFMPNSKGQGRGNSGVYIQSRYELQVLDSFGLDGKDNECGGIYQVASPRVNMCFPPLAWQTYDIDFTAAKWQDGKKVKNARVTIKHNGFVIHKDLELPKQTPGRWKEAAESAPLFLQDHGNPVVFRNVWVVKK